MAVKISRQEYCDMYGPTAGDKIHLADTGLIAEIEKDYATYGDELLFGGGKTHRDGMGNISGATTEDGVLDTVFANAVIIDPMIGIIKGDIGIRDGKIVGIGKCGNPDTMDITQGLIVGAATEVISAEGMILTPGGIDVHIHFESPNQAWEALSNGITTMIGGGSGSQTTSVETPGPSHLLYMIKCHEELPINAGFWARGNSSKPEAIREQALNGAIGMKIHEDFGATPEVIRCCLEVADENGFSGSVAYRHTE